MHFDFNEPRYNYCHLYLCIVKFIYSEKATKFCEISIVDLTITMYIGQIYGGDFAKFCGLLRIYELYVEKENKLFNKEAEVLRI